MKFGFRKPSPKKSFKARTTGKLKRKLKKAVNPFYEKKGMGWVKNPKKAMYNKIYNKTSFGINDLLKTANNTKPNKTVVKPPLTEDRKSSSPKFNQIEHEKNLADDFFIKYYEQVQSMEKEMIDMCQQAAGFKDNIDVKIELCNKAIDMFYALKRFCSRSKGGKLYFSEMWEHCHNSKNEDFSYIEDIEDLLKELKSNYDDYNDYYTKLKTLDTDLLKFISDNAPIIQRDIYKHFHARMKSDIQKYIRAFEKSGLITREKKSSSYILNVTPLSKKHLQ